METAQLHLRCVFDAQIRYCPVMMSPDTAVFLLERYGYLFLFLIALVEGPIITIIGAFLASQGYFNIYVVTVIVTVGDLSGECLLYGLGRLGRIGAFASLRRRLGMTGERFARFERYVAQHGIKILFLAKYTQTGLLALPAAGAARMPLTTFVLYNTLATIPKTLALVITGYFFGYAYHRIDSYMAKAALIGFSAIVVTGAYLFVRRFFRARYGEP